MSDREAIAFRRLNELPDADFTRLLEDVFRGGPWVVEAVIDQRPFSSVRALHGAMLAAISEASDRLQIKLIAAQPDALEDRGDMEDDDLAEAATELGRRYRSRFGFAYVVAEQPEEDDAFVSELERRLANEPRDERTQALREIVELARHRLEELLRHREDDASQRAG